jgi:predicted metal-dependent phosphoesterase TrpH
MRLHSYAIAQNYKNISKVVIPMPKKFDLHVHTNYSDGINSPKEVVRQAKEVGLDGMAIADHDTVKGTKKARKTAEDVGIILIPAVEITTPFGDILALGIEEAVEPRKKGRKMITDIINRIHELGGIAIAAHPYAGYWPMKFADMKEIRAFDAIEIFNALSSLNFGIEANIKAMELANRLKKPGTAGSDAHSLDLIGTAFTVAKGKNVIDEIKKGRAKVGWV